jgi:hypothetical protein
VSYKAAAGTAMKWYGLDPADFLLQFKGDSSETLSVRIKASSGKKKAKADGGLSLEAARTEIARIAAKEATDDQKAFAW